MSKRARYYICILASALLSGFSVMLPDYLGFIAYFSMVPLCLALYGFVNDALPIRKIYGFMLIYFVCFYAVSFHFFIYMYPLDFTGINNFFSVLVIIVAWFGIPLLQALISSAFFIPFAILSRIGCFKSRPYIMPIAFAVLYTVLEWFQIFGWWGVPWARLSLSQSAYLPLISSASLFGSYFITFIIATVNAAVAYALRCGRALPRMRVCFCAVALFAFCINLTLGVTSYTVTKKDIEDDEKLRVGVIQGNFSSKDVDTPYAEEHVEVYQKYTELAAAEGATLVVWPETSVPYHVEPDGYIEKMVSRIARDNSVNIIWGGIRYDDDGGVYNCAFYVHSDGTVDKTVYKKRHLVPFGEYLPMRGFIDVLLPFLADINLITDDMTPGEGSELFEVDGYGKVGAIICFDSIYESLTLQSVRDGAELIVLGTNDSWFSDSLAIYLHNNQARFRSIETGRYTARAAVTGVCSIITPTGEILGMTEPLCEGYLVGEVSVREHRTLYSYIGNSFVYLLILAAVGYFAYELVHYCMVRHSAAPSKKSQEDRGNEES